MKDRISTIEHNGKKVIMMDARKLSGKQILDINEAFMEYISGMDKDRSLRIFIDGRDCIIDSEALKSNKEWNKAVQPYTKRLALIGMFGFKKAMFNAIAFSSPIKMKAMNSKEEALDWLTED